MGGYIKRDIERFPVMGLNQKVNKEIFDNFKDYCKQQGYPMNVIIETFMFQYSNGRFHLDSEDIVKWKRMEYEEEVLNTTFNKEIYLGFKKYCKSNGYFVKDVLMAFMEKYSSRKYVMEFVFFDKNGDK